MESHPLNLAHQQHRRADAHLMNHRYDEAMQCHLNAAELLLDAMKSTTSSVALESITMQHSYHLKQKDLIKSKKEQYARVKKAMDQIKQLSKDQTHTIQDKDYSSLQVAIYKAINETDSLLNILSNKEIVEHYKDAPGKGDVTEGKKIDKSPQIVIEELQILSQNLHSLVEQLVLQVEVLKDENMTLKEKVTYLEKERVRYLNLPSSNSEFILKNNFSTLGMTPEDFSKELVPTSFEQQISRPSKLSIEKPSHQAHFDLSALND